MKSLILTVIAVIFVSCLGFVWLVGIFCFAGHSWAKLVGHKLFGWHSVRQVADFDGLSFSGYCEICEKRCLMDSNGEWF